MRSWPLQEARAHLRDVIDLALEQGPQRITRYGKQAVVVVAEEQWNRHAVPTRSFGDLLVAYPASETEPLRRRPARAIRHRSYG